MSFYILLSLFRGEKIDLCLLRSEIFYLKAMNELTNFGIIISSDVDVEMSFETLDLLIVEIATSFLVIC